MAYPSKFTDDDFKKLKLQGYSNRKIAEELGVCRQAVDLRAKTLAKRGWSPEHSWNSPVPEGYSISGVSQYVDEYGKVLRQWVKSEKDKEEQEVQLKAMLEAFKEELPKYAPVKSDNKGKLNKDLLVCLPLGDQHWAMMAWGKECGEDWDLSIARKVFSAGFKRVIAASPSCEEALIVNVGDMFHYSSMDAVTPAHQNQLDADTRYAKMVREVVLHMRFMINECLDKYNKVSVINACGNHSTTSELFLAICLEQVYENEPRVFIDTNPTPLHYFQWGKNMIAVNHGDKIKPERLAGVIAADQPKMWGDTRYRTVLCGHLHCDILREYPGITVETFRTLAARDSYAAWAGYRSDRDTKSLVFHKEWGQVERHIINIEQIKDNLKDNCKN